MVDIRPARRTQWTRARTSGAPNPLVRGGWTSNGIAPHGDGLQAAPQAMQLRMADAGADAPSVKSTGHLDRNRRATGALKQGRIPSGSVSNPGRLPIR